MVRWVGNLMKLYLMPILLLIFFFYNSCESTNDLNISTNEDETNIISEKELEERKYYYTDFYMLRRSEDLNNFSTSQLDNIEAQYSIANDNWNTQIAIITFSIIIFQTMLPWEYIFATLIGTTLIIIQSLQTLYMGCIWVRRTITRFTIIP